MYRTFHSTAIEYTFFSNTHGVFSRIDHILGYKQVLTNLRKSKSFQHIVSDHSGIKKLQINNKRNQEYS